MNNTHALLLAFIEASGYEVEEVVSVDEDRYHADIQSQIRKNNYMKSAGTPIFDPAPLMVDYRTTDYKVTKKQSHIDEDYEAVTHLMAQFKKGKHEIMRMKYNGKSYIYSDKGGLVIE